MMRTIQERITNLELLKRSILTGLRELAPYDPDNKEERAFLLDQLDNVLEKLNHLKVEDEQSRIKSSTNN